MSVNFINNFEGFMAGDYKINGNNVFIKLKKDKITKGYTKNHNYNHHFHFGIRNDGVTKENIKFFIGCDNCDYLDKKFKRIWISEDIDKEYRLIKIDGSMKVPGRYYFAICIQPGVNTFISNFFPIRYSKMKEAIDILSEKISAKARTIGKTVEYRDIIAFEIGNVLEKPSIMMVSGYHPPEVEPIFIEAIMNKFLDINWKDEVLKDFSFVFIPFMNSDGFVHMKQGSNLNDINFHWRFFGNSKEECPESHYIWEYCKKVKPIFFMDFHVFTFQNNEARPYIISPHYYFNKISKKILLDINNVLIALCRGQSSMSEKILAPDILSSRLRIELGTIISPKFHLHIKDGKVNSQKLALDTFLSIVNILRRYKVKSNDQILYRPYGKVQKNSLFKIKMKILDIINFKIIPNLRRI